MISISLSQGKTTIIDDCDFNIVSSLRWFAFKSGNTFYAHANTRNENGERIGVSMHRLIMNAPKLMLVDHINMNGLDNRRVNMRVCSRSQNSQNRIKTRGVSRFKGVTWHKPSKRWTSYIEFHTKKIFVGMFSDEYDAALAYDAAAKIYFGEFARLNFPPIPNMGALITPEEINKMKTVND
jgi:hypothetical protein